jgi:uncharacterized protein YgfB (UPF0149 family)
MTRAEDEEEQKENIIEYIGDSMEALLLYKEYLEVSTTYKK